MIPRPLAVFTGPWLAVAALTLGPVHAARAQPASERMTFALVGDAIITQRLSPFAEPEYLSMLEVIRRADAAFANLEVLFHTFEEGEPAANSGGTWMAAHPRLAHELAWAGFDLVSLANNHTMDWGAGGLRATIQAVEAADLTYAGAGESLGRARAPGYRETAGGRVALISVASTFSDEHRAGPQRGDVRGRPGLSPLRYVVTYQVSGGALARLRDVAGELGVNPGRDSTRLRFLGNTFELGQPPRRQTAPHPGDLQEITAAVAEARRQADWVIVTSHTHEGGRSREEPADFLVAFAHAVIDAGADIFVGHGPHVLRGVEVYRGKPVFYSLANFIFQNETVRFLPGDFYAELDLGAEATPADGFDRRNERSNGGFPADRIYWESVVAVPTFVRGSLSDIRLYPIELGHGRPRPQRGRPRLADRVTGRRIIEKLAELSKPFGVTVRYDERDNVGIVSH
jgi:poly-gamma-glutamate synthesis protein (capsule biosynthesis protein)